jgi:hypothetical protein
MASRGSLRPRGTAYKSAMMNFFERQRFKPNQPHLLAKLLISSSVNANGNSQKTTPQNVKHLKNSFFCLPPVAMPGANAIHYPLMPRQALCNDRFMSSR